MDHLIQETQSNKKKTLNLGLYSMYTFDKMHFIH